MLPDLIARSLHRFIDRSNSRALNHSDNNAITIGQQNQDHEFLLNMLLQSVSPDSFNLTSNPHILNLIHKLYNLEQGNTPTTAYLHRAKHLVDQLAVAGRPITLSEFNIFALKGLRPEFKDLAITLAARPGPVSFPELHSLLLSHEFIHGGDSFSCLPLPQPSSIDDLPISANYHAHGFSTNHSGGPGKGLSLIPGPIPGPNRNSSPDSVSRFCQWCSTPGHTAKSCHFLQRHRSLSESRAVDQDYGGNHDQHLISTMEKRNSTVAMKNSKIQHIEDDIDHINLKGDNSIVKITKDDQINSKAKDDNSGISRDDFPEDFVFGTATSSYQFEGAAAQGGRGLGVWDVFTMETPDRIFDGTNGNVAVDMYNRYKEDIEMMNKMGFDACRISISWPRILPGGRRTAGINREGINFYNDLINTLLAHGWTQ